MLVGFYKGDHKKDGILARLGYMTIRIGQVNELYGEYTHCEAIFNNDYKNAEIGSASVRDGNQVRITTKSLNPEHWTILDVPSKDAARSKLWFLDNAGKPYSKVGAMSSAVWIVRFILKVINIKPWLLGFWCSYAVPKSMDIVGGENMNVAEFKTVLINLPGTIDVTLEYFKNAEI